MIDWYALTLYQTLPILELTSSFVNTYSSHGNSEKKHERQVNVAEDVARQLGSSETAENIMGVMIESHLVEGKQSIPASGAHNLTYGQSITYARCSLPHSCSSKLTCRVKQRRLYLVGYDRQSS